MERSYKKVSLQNLPKWDFKTQHEFEGQLIQVQENVGPNKSMLYTFKLEDGTKMVVWGQTVLDNRLALVEVGSWVKILYHGLKLNEKSKRKYYDFEVFVDEASGAPAHTDGEPVPEEPVNGEDVNVEDIPF